MTTTLWIIAMPFALLILVALWVLALDIRDSFIQRRKERWMKTMYRKEALDRLYGTPTMAVYKKDVNGVRPER
jgi:hypothetical protein